MMHVCACVSQQVNINSCVMLHVRASVSACLSELEFSRV